MTSINSEDALRGQQTRIMNAMRNAMQPAPGSDLRDIASALTTQNNGGASYFDTMRKLNQDQSKVNIDMETGIYNQMKEQVARGNAEAKGVDDAIAEVAGSDPKLYASILQDLHADPDPVNASNAKSKVMKYAAQRGITPLSTQTEQAKISKLKAEAVKDLRGGEDPALIKTTKAYMNASQEERDIMDRFGKVYDKNMQRDANGNLVPIAGAVDSLANIEKAKSTGRETGKANAAFVAKAQQNLPQVLDSAQYLSEHLDAVLDHPGKKYYVGKGALLPVVPGTKQADFKARMEQINGDAFLQAYDTLKGGGQITEIEGEKATKAKNRMQRAQSVKDFDDAAKEYKTIVKQATKRAIDAARGNTVGVENVDRTVENVPDKVMPKRLKYNPATGEFE